MDLLNIDDLIKYGGLLWGIITTALVTNQQITLLKQRNDFGKFCIEILNKYNEIENELDARFDRNEEKTLLQIERLSTRIKVNEAQISSAQGWIKTCYNYILFEATELPIIEKDGKEI